MLSLEAVCAEISGSAATCEREDVEALVWQRKLKNIASKLSLALSECKGPRHFHQHYKHRADDDSILTPVLDDPLETLKLTCRSALAECQSGFGGLQDPILSADIRVLEREIKVFLNA